MDILSYLTALIKTHKEVGIPGLGTIYKKKSPGRYDVETHSFLPPSYSLNFTSDLKEQILLAELISKKKNISTDSAIYFIEEFAQHVLDELSNHQESDFGDLGTFSTASGSLTFIPKQDNSFGFDFYGLPSLKADLGENKKENEEEAPAVIEELSVDDEPKVAPEQLEQQNNNTDLNKGTFELLSNEAIHSPTAQESQSEAVIEIPERIIEENVPGHFTIDYTDHEKSGIPVFLKVIIGLATIFIIAVIAYLVKPELFEGAINHPVNNTPKEDIPKPDTVKLIRDKAQAKLDSIARADSIRISNEKAIQAIDSTKNSTVNTPVEKSSDHPVVSYDIIAASLLNKKEADRFLEDMKRRGIPAKIAQMPGRRIKISIGSFSDEDTAKKELEVLKKTTRIPGIYVIAIKHTNNPK